MADMETSDELSRFLDSGVYRFSNSNAVFLDSVRVLNRSYTRFRASPSAYYSRSFQPKHLAPEPAVASDSRKRKRKPKKPRPLNERELAADRRHQEARPWLLKAHESLLGAADLLSTLSKLRSCSCSPMESSDESSSGVEHSFVQLGKLWQAPLCEITLNFNRQNDSSCHGGLLNNQSSEQRELPIFNNLVVNETFDDVEAEFLNRHYVLPGQSSFYMSDLGQIHNIVPAESDCGFNLIVIDPPWENGSARQKSVYPTLPNRYFLSLPIKKLTHTDGALVALWVTNREKLRKFVEEELFPVWGVRYLATFYWLKVKVDGSLISDLDLFHHRPYECLLLGYCSGKIKRSEHPAEFTSIKDNKVIISIPGDYSRKPPIGELLLDCVPGVKPGRFIELFAREMIAGWVSWGNEPLHFQDTRYFPRDEPVN